MNYKLYKDLYPDFSATQQVLYNRNIPIEKQKEWLEADQKNINNWCDFCYAGESVSRMNRAVDLLHEAIEKNKNVQIVVDSDCDGYTSSAIIINYLYALYPEWTHFHLKYIMHKGKEHGLADTINSISDDTFLVIVPDAGSNDIEEHKILAEKNIQVLVLDHHEINVKSEHALVVNVQDSTYPNKALTGAGVAWQFCRAFDELYAEEPHANDFIDLAALGNCGDMASYKELEIRAFCNLGFSNIKNPFFFSMAKKNDYSIQKMNGINYYSMAFYVVPFINATIRSGTMEEKKMVFESMLSEYAFEKVESSKRGEKGVLVPLYQEAVTIAERVKRRQTKLQDEAIALLEKQIEDRQLLNNSILVFLCEPGEVEKNILGLVANKFQAKYQRPCAILIRSKQKEDKEEFYRGSMRNYSLSPVENLKAELEKTGEIEFCAGHKNAAGLSIAASHINSFLKKFNERYKDIDQTPIYWVDYIWDTKTIDKDKILEIADLNVYGQEIPESFVALQDVYLPSTSIALMSPQKNPTLRIQIGDISIIKFKSSQEEYEAFCQDDMVLTAICKCNKNEWNGSVSPQLIIEDFELEEEWIF